MSTELTMAILVVTNLVLIIKYLLLKSDSKITFRELQNTNFAEDTKEQLKGLNSSLQEELTGCLINNQKLRQFIIEVENLCVEHSELSTLTDFFEFPLMLKGLSIETLTSTLGEKATVNPYMGLKFHSELSKEFTNRYNLIRARYVKFLLVNSEEENEENDVLSMPDRPIDLLDLPLDESDTPDVSPNEN
jgi:hypothetical protein